MTTYEQWRKKNWDRAHAEQDESALTGTGLKPHLIALNAEKRLSEDTKLLCIGVGTGRWVQEADAIVRDIWALDVSPLANRNLPSSVVFVTDPASLPSDYFNLALSLWVAPHMSNLDLLRQTTEVLRSLMSNGILAIHYKEPLEPEDTFDNREGAEDEWKIARRAHVLRRPRHFEAMMKFCGGEIVYRAPPNCSQYHGINEQVVHARRTK